MTPADGLAQGSAPHADRPDAGGAGGQRVLVSAMKNESPFLLEWVAYHRVIGFDRIVVFSNSSNDGTEELLAALAAAGAIAHHHVDPPLEVSPQTAAAQRFAEVEGYRDGNWYLWLDADEFLNIRTGSGMVADLVAAIGPRQGIMLNWRLFGTSGHARFPGRFVSQDFPGASSLRLSANRETKTLFRKSPGIEGFAAKPIYRPKLARDHGLSAEDFLTGSGAPLGPDSVVTRQWLEGNGEIRSNIVQQKELSWDLAQINHYSVRTPEFFRLKALRGRGAQKAQFSQNLRHTEEYFRRFNLNGQSDLSIAVWEAAVTREMARLMALPGVAGAVEAAARLTEAALQATLIEPDAPAETMPAAVALAPEAEAASPGEEKKITPELEAFYSGARVILEYGSGESTLLAARLGATVFSVESDRGWADRIARQGARISDRVQVHYADVGPTQDWGKPADVTQFRKWHGYALSVWDRPNFVQPDLVLIDGRFRAACLVAVLLRSKAPVTVLFDDYVGRRFYHAVEHLARKEETIGRMARFTVSPGPIPPEMLTQAIGWFTDPR